jgi:hypothetical protein
MSGKNTEVHAGVTLRARFSATQTGPCGAEWQGGHLNFPLNALSMRACALKGTDWEKCGLYPELNFIHIPTLILGVAPENVISTEFTSSDPQFSYRGGGLCYDTSNLASGMYDIIRSVVQNASRRDRRYLFVKVVRHTENVDQAALSFTVLDPSSYIDTVYSGLARKFPLATQEELVAMVKASYLEQEAGSVRLITSPASFNMLASFAQDVTLQVASRPVVPTYNFSVNFVDQSGSFLKCVDNNISIYIRDPVGNEKEYKGGVSQSFGGFSAGNYQMKVVVPGYGEKNWFPFDPKDGTFNLKLRGDKR